MSIFLEESGVWSQTPLSTLLQTPHVVYGNFNLKHDSAPNTTCDVCELQYLKHLSAPNTKCGVWKFRKCKFCSLYYFLSWCKYDTPLCKGWAVRISGANSSRAKAVEDLADKNNLCDAVINFVSILLSGRCGVRSKHHSCPQEVWTRYTKHLSLQKGVSYKIV